jgi:hypothetical protein
MRRFLLVFLSMIVLQVFTFVTVIPPAPMAPCVAMPNNFFDLRANLALGFTKERKELFNNPSA